MDDQRHAVRSVTWPQVVLTLGIVALLLTAVIVLAIARQNVMEILAAIVLSLTTLLGLLGWQKQDNIEKKMDQVKEISNGRLSEALEAQKQLQEEYKELSRQYAELALRMPPEAVVEVGDR